MKTEATTSASGQTNASEQSNFDYSKAEMRIKNITIPESQFHAKWVKDEGYAIGYENLKISKDYETLEEALNQIGYGVDIDNEGDEILVKTGEIDFELIARLIKAINIIENQNKNQNG